MKFWSCVLIAGLSMPLNAQTLSPATSIPADQVLTAASGVTAQCMARTTTKHDGHDWTFVVPVPADVQADYAAKGFQPTACGTLSAGLADHKRLVCDLATGNDTVQVETEAQLGMDGRHLCEVAKRLLPDKAASPVAQVN